MPGISKHSIFTNKSADIFAYSADPLDATKLVRTPDKAFALVRAQRGKHILFDCRDPQYILDRSLRAVARPWLEKVAGPYKSA